MTTPVYLPEPLLGHRLLSLADIAVASVELLHNASLSRPFVAKREWLPRFDLSDLGSDLKVAVTAGESYSFNRTSRNSWSREPEIRILVVGALQSEPFDAEIDDLFAFVEEVRSLFAHNDLPLAASFGCDAPQVRASSILMDPPISFESLEQLRQFTSSLSCTFRVLDAA